jgi:hypothetical protein
VDQDVRSVDQDVRSVDQDDLEKKLVTAREEFLKGHPSFRMIGVEFICPPIHHQKICGR